MLALRALTLPCITLVFAFRPPVRPTRICKADVPSAVTIFMCNPREGSSALSRALRNRAKAAPAGLFLEIDVDQFLAGAVLDDEACIQFLD